MARPKKPVSTPRQPNFLEDYDDLPINTPSGRKHLARLMPAMSNYRTFRQDIEATALWARMSLYERVRSDPKALHDRLDDLENKLTAALAALGNLGLDGAKALEDRAARQDARPPGDRGETVWQWLENEGFKPSGGDRVQWVGRVLTDAVRWAAEARVGINSQLRRVIIDPPNPNDPHASPRRRGGGRPSDPTAEAAMRNLIGIWEEQANSRPTVITDGLGYKYGPFLEFCEAFFLPIYEKYGLQPPSCAALAQKILYPPKTG